MGKSCKPPGYTLYVRLEQHRKLHMETHLCTCVLISFNIQLKCFIQHFSFTLHSNSTSSVSEEKEKKKKAEKLIELSLQTKSMLGRQSPSILISCKKVEMMDYSSCELITQVENMHIFHLIHHLLCNRI